VRLWDKVARYENLTGQEGDEMHESISDTLADIIGYVIIYFRVRSGGFSYPLAEFAETANPVDLVEYHQVNLPEVEFLPAPETDIKTAVNAPVDDTVPDEWNLVSVEELIG
jgi:hypothetical protein